MWGQLRAARVGGCLCLVGSFDSFLKSRSRPKQALHGDGWHSKRRSRAQEDSQHGSHVCMSGWLFAKQLKPQRQSPYPALKP